MHEDIDKTRSCQAIQTVASSARRKTNNTYTAGWGHDGEANRAGRVTECDGVIMHFNGGHIYAD